MIGHNWLLNSANKDGFEFGIGIEGRLAEITADTTFLKATKGQLSVNAVAAVNGEDTRFDCACHPKCFGNVACPYGTR
jgi:hypothetical protein